jgi:hypothetical protein
MTSSALSRIHFWYASLAALLACLLPLNASAATVNYSLDLSVPGSFALKAQTSLGDNAGLAYYSVPLSGNVLTLNHRSPVTLNLTDFSSIGFSLLRSHDNPPAFDQQVLASQDFISAPLANLIYGFGQEASSFAAKGYTTLGGIIDPTSDQSWSAPLVLATGTYSGPLSINRNSPNFSASVFTTQGQRVVETATVFDTPPCLCGISVSGGSIKNVDANNPGFVDFTFTAFADLPAPGPLTWGGLGFGGYFLTPGNPGPPGTGPAVPAILDPVTHKFHWVTVGSPLGQYRWFVRASAQGYTDTGILDVFITKVPEPATPSLVGLAILGFSILIRRGRLA